MTKADKVVRQGDTVGYVLRGGAKRPATVTQAFPTLTSDGPKCNLTVHLDLANDLCPARQVTGELDQPHPYAGFVKPHLLPSSGAYAPIPGVIAASSCQYDPTGETEGTWHWLEGH